MATEAQSTKKFMDHLAPFLHPNASSLPFAVNGMKDSKSTAKWSSLPPRKPGALDAHFRQAKHIISSDPSFRTLATMDTSMSGLGESSRCESFNEFPCVRAIEEDGNTARDSVLTLPEDPGNPTFERRVSVGLDLDCSEHGSSTSVAETDSVHSLQEMEEGMSRTVAMNGRPIPEDPGVERSNAPAKYTQEAKEGPRERFMGWSRASRLQAIKALPPIKGCASSTSLLSIEEATSGKVANSACSKHNMDEDLDYSVHSGASEASFVIRCFTTASKDSKRVLGGSFELPKKPRPGLVKAMSRRRSSGSTSLKSFSKSMRSLLLRQNSGLSSVMSHLYHDEYALIEETLQRNFMFKHLSAGALHNLVMSFTRDEVEKDDIIVRQGESCENGYVYIVAEGECSVFVDGNVVPGPYGTLSRKALFGELGVLYNAKRGATISVKSEQGVLFRAKGKEFANAFNQDTTEETPKPIDDELTKIDEAINQLSGTTSKFEGGEIIPQYKPSRKWLWSRWHGTVFEQTNVTAICMMLLSFVFVLIVRLFGEPTWSVGMAPDEDHVWIQTLTIVRKIWVYQMTFTTFILTFYVNQAYMFWNETVNITRGLQGRQSDFFLLLATTIERNEDGTFTRESEALLDDVGASSRLFHMFFWASCANRYNCLLTETGMERIVQRGIMTQKQLKVLQGLGTAEGSKHYACLEWMMIRAWQGIHDGLLTDSPSLSQQLLEKMCKLRSLCATFVDIGKTRMPLVYTHFVQILVDTFVLLSPFALYGDLGVYSIFCVGMITLFYTGLLDLAKVFLDPLDNQVYSKKSGNLGVDLGVLTSESNAASVHFKDLGAMHPFERSISALHKQGER
ncbi:protein kinase, cAMP-dependent, regulatory, type [Seminavis robusta]|uniref:Protein kinase, cAMP-dependent, regulatory, type n=1 Tax=Seminavis robusta TaxID=568900 RepID=A0A9N8H1W3_9STRA|nr:protein kinase, cAMP-dependent, regulatory, type [Seminavis robusta]|eukprot:Sro1_g000090.1 protein kinase, cAMP-dependent, regulatory, type (849) ;mRNA; r:31582-34128